LNPLLGDEIAGPFHESAENIESPKPDLDVDEDSSFVTPR
jgi:hypothetical protein